MEELVGYMQDKQKNPHTQNWAWGFPFFIPHRLSPAHSRPAEHVLFLGRSSGSRIILLAAPSHPVRTVAYCSFRPRLQRWARSRL